MKMQRYIATLLLLMTFGSAVRAQIPTARVGDVTRLQGQGVNHLTGFGLVTGLNGTGDGNNYLPTIKQLKNMLERFGSQAATLDEVKGAKNVAVVTVEVVIPEHGAREGDLIDVQVTALAAKSLEGGRLLSTPLLYHDPTVKDLFGFAFGRIKVSETILTSGVIRGGARMERDVFMNVVAQGSDIRMSGIGNPWINPNETYITLVLDEVHAGWSMAAAIAQALDKELSVSADVERVALAVDSKSIVVLLPAHQRTDAASWIRDVERTPILMESNEARIAINRSAGTIVVSGDTRLSAVVISQRGLTVTVANPLPDGSEIPPPAFDQQGFVPLDRESDRLANVNDLLEALNRLKVPFADRVSILEQVRRAGKLHARIIYEG